MYYEVDNTHESLEATVFYNINLKVDHIVFSVADMRGMYGEKVNRIPHIAPAVNSTIKEIEKMSPYWVSQGEQTEEITDKHLVTLGKHQQQFLGSFQPKPNETGDAHLEMPPADRKSALQHPLQYLQQFPVSPSLQNVPILPNIQIQPDGTAFLIQQLVNVMKVSQTDFEKTVENLNKIAEGMKMIKQQNEEIANVNKGIYNKQKKYDQNLKQLKQKESKSV